MFGFHGSLRVFSVGLLGLILTGCLSKEEIRRIESRPEGTGITLSRLPEMIRILVKYEAAPPSATAHRERPRNYSVSWKPY